MALLIFPHWQSSAWTHKAFAKSLLDFRAIIYHYSASLLTSDIEFTLRNFEKLENEIWSDVARLKTEGVALFDFYGTSLGSIVATRAANLLAGRRENIQHIILNLSAASFPSAVWNGTATRHMREEFNARGVTYDQLEEAWGFLSPINNLSNLKRQKILFFASLRDKIFGESNVKNLVAEFHANFPNAKIYTNRFLGHRSGGAKNLLRIRIIKDFLGS